MPRSAAATPSQPRLAFLDPIRVALTALVIIHHSAIAYGGSGSWYYQEPGAPERAQRLLTLLTATDQTFFMGFFFLIAGYLMPASVARKGASAWLGERAIRLGLPLLLYGYLLHPLTLALAAGARGESFSATLAERIMRGAFSVGPLWFNQALLIFAVVWLLAPGHPRSWPQPWLRAPHLSVAIAALGCGVLAFVLRLLLPVGQSLFAMQLGYFASYIILYFAGCALARSRALEQIEWRHAWPWLLVSAITFPWLWIVVARLGPSAFNDLTGGWHLAALCYAMWEPLVAVGIIATSLAVARRHYRGNALCQRLAQAAYLAFVIHPPVAVACEWAVSGVTSSHLLRFLCAATLACLGAFALAMLLGAIRWPKPSLQAPMAS